MKKLSVVSFILIAMLIIAGCAGKSATTDNAELKEIKTAQQEILTIQKTILAKVENIEKNIKNVQTPPSRPTIDYNKVHNIPIGKSIFKGKAEAPVTIVEFSDFQCPYCARLQPTLKDVLKAYPDDVKLVYKHYPLSFHKQAKNAAKASEAAREQGKFWEMHDLIYENFNKLADNSFADFAQKLGLNMDQFKADYASNKYDQLIQSDINMARQVNVTGTPTLFMNGKRMQRRSFDDFKADIDKNLKK